MAKTAGSLALVGMLWATTPAWSADAPVRSSDQWVQAAIEDGKTRSTTFSFLVARLTASDVVVYVDAGSRGTWTTKWWRQAIAGICGYSSMPGSSTIGSSRSGHFNGVLQLVGDDDTCGCCATGTARNTASDLVGIDTGTSIAFLLG